MQHILNKQRKNLHLSLLNFYIFNQNDLEVEISTNFVVRNVNNDTIQTHVFPAFERGLYLDI